MRAAQIVSQPQPEPKPREFIEGADMGTAPIRFGIYAPQQSVKWQELLELWQKADGWGYDSLWVFDHFYPIFADPDGPCFEGWTALTALAQATTRARVGMLVAGNTYRHPCVMAKMAATLDHIAGGRLNVGIGAGWFELEHREFGVDFKSKRGRLDALEEACQIILGMFSQDHTTLAGRHYTVSNVRCVPKPLQQPHPPIMIGGSGEKVLLKIVARYADMWNSFQDAARMRQLIDVIRRHAEVVGRDPDQIEKTVLLPLGYQAPQSRQESICHLIAKRRQTTPEAARQQAMIGGKQECLDTIERYVRAGVTHFIFSSLPPYFMEEFQGFAEDVVPAARG